MSKQSHLNFSFYNRFHHTISSLLSWKLFVIFIMNTTGCDARFRRFHRASASPSRTKPHEVTTSPRASDSVHPSDSST